MTNQTMLSKSSYLSSLAHDIVLSNKLTTLSGAAFDAEYKKVQVDGHTMTLKLIQTYRTVAKDAQAAAYAAKTQPVVAKHLDHAKMLPGS